MCVFNYNVNIIKKLDTWKYRVKKFQEVVNNYLANVKV